MKPVLRQVLFQLSSTVMWAIHSWSAGWMTLVNCLGRKFTQFTSGGCRVSGCRGGASDVSWAVGGAGTGAGTSGGSLGCSVVSWAMGVVGAATSGRSVGQVKR